MNFKLMEYNTTPIAEKRRPFSIQLVDDYIQYNDQKITDSNKINEVKNVLNKYRSEIVKLNEGELSNALGGRQQVIRIQYEDGETLTVLGNTPVVEMKNLYSEIRSQLINIIEQ